MNFSEDKEFCERYENACNELEEESGIKEGAHVRYKGVSEELLEFAHYCGHPTDPRGKLILDHIYEIEYRITARSYSLVQLVGFGEDKFSPGIFEAINHSEEKKYLKVGGRVLYVGQKYDDVLKKDTIYEVERIISHACGIGYTGIKLVGFEKVFDRGMFQKVVKNKIK